MGIINILENTNTKKKTLSPACDDHDYYFRVCLSLETEQDPTVLGPHVRSRAFVCRKTLAKE